MSGERDPRKIKQLVDMIGLALSASHNTVTTDAVDAQPDDLSWRIDHSKELQALAELEDVLGVDAESSITRPNPHGQIIHEIGKALGILNAPSGLMAIAMSWGDTLPQDEILQQLKEWNAICQPPANLSEEGLAAFQRGERSNKARL